MFKLILILMFPVIISATEIWTELYSESAAQSTYTEALDSYYGTLAAGATFKLMDTYVIAHQYGATIESAFDIGLGIRKTFDVKGIYVNPFGELLFQKDIGHNNKIGIFLSCRKEIK